MEKYKKISRILLSLVIVLGVSVLSISPLVYANQGQGKTTTGSVQLIGSSKLKVNNYIHNFSKAYSSIPMNKSAAMATYKVTTANEYEAKVNYAIANKASGVTISYTGPKIARDTVSFMQNTVLKVIKTAGNDYEKNLLEAYTYSITDFGNNKFNATYTFSYLETDNQQNQVKAKVKAVLGQIITSNMTEAQKVKAINSYICKKLSYDTSLTNFSDYNGLLGSGKTVCQGYALLAYRMLTDAGLKARIITGTANNGIETESHAWNMVVVGGSWYHLDTTWNDPLPDVNGRVMETYSLRSDAQMRLNHTWDKTLFPVASKNYTTSDNTKIPTTLPVPTLSLAQITVVNNSVNNDSVKVTGLIRGDVVRVYTSNGKILLGSASAIVTMSKNGVINTKIKPYVNMKLKAQLSETVRVIKVTVTNSSKRTSRAAAKTYAKVQRSLSLVPRYVSVAKGKVCVKGLLAGDIVNVYAANPALTKGAISRVTVKKGYSYLFASFNTKASKLYVTRTSVNKLQSAAIMIKR